MELHWLIGLFIALCGNQQITESQCSIDPERDVDRVIVYALSPLAMTPHDVDRLSFFDMWLFDGMKSLTIKNSDDIGELITNLNSLQLDKSIHYGPLDSDTHYQTINGRLSLPIHQSPDIKGAIIFQFKNGEYELVWLNQFTVNIGHCLYHTDKYFTTLLKEIGIKPFNCPESLKNLYLNKIPFEILEE
ncbi:MAG: hypothetical protein K2H58_01000 [Paramuribaculum sp.]|nr:hypothetical protein [Paramuribaculum sp.]